ncbi:hypothetical protein KIN20_016294 [Parelaphostrongylus tenuis]|uniref:Uncharacterized protein n=1 Tax=Parelaphostrongylus tenuis TaxID=148309 RepID=A0AAD5MJT0_PARTN|nr:hypothetical protein KIN20_016294 [Parelaphostrongylus tenuis]
MVTIIPVTPNATISGAVLTTNIIMANWPRCGKVWWAETARMLAFGPFGPHFFLAPATVDGN